MVSETKGERIVSQFKIGNERWLDRNMIYDEVKYFRQEAERELALQMLEKVKTNPCAFKHIGWSVKDDIKLNVLIHTVGVEMYDIHTVGVEMYDQIVKDVWENETTSL
jgi:hypothetical protein